ncbi:MAG TPA: hypothetical protein VHM90_17630, partial [Phycisphaerae bacterium]|nr:hypothetical protein [Phycisphaerae bacterium]
MREANATRMAEYRGPRDVGRAESLYKSALTKSDADYCLQLLFSALLANPEHAAAFQAIMGKSVELAEAKRKVSVRIADSLTGSPADDFVRSLALYITSWGADQGVACAAEAQKIGLVPMAVAMGERVARQWQEGQAPVRAASVTRLVDVLEAGGALEIALRTLHCGMQAFPHDASMREREKNLLATKYLLEHEPETFQGNLKNRPQQEATQRPLDPAARLDELEQQYKESQRLEDFRELVRSLREAPGARREAALATLQDGFQRFGEKETRWFIREIKLERRWAEVRLQQKLAEESPADAAARQACDTLRRDVLREQIDHLYEVVSSLPPGPDRARREMELTRRLLDAGRHEEAVKQAQKLKGRAEFRTDAWIVMAKAFVRMGLAMEAAACFENILAALNTE